MLRPADVFTAALTVARVAEEHDVKYPAAALAYYAFVALVPVLVLVLTVVGESVAAQLQGAAPRFITPEARRLVYESMTAASGRVGAALLAVVTLAWSGSNVAVDFLTVIERVEENGRDSLFVQFRDAVSVLGSLVLAVLVAVVTSALFALPAAGPRPIYGGLVVVPVALTVAFLPLYYLPSRTVTSPKGALPGALVAAFGWTALLTGIQFYAANAGQYAIYGVLSGIIIILTGLYLAAIVLMVGVVVNVAFADVDAVAD